MEWGSPSPSLDLRQRPCFHSQHQKGWGEQQPLTPPIPGASLLPQTDGARPDEGQRGRRRTGRGGTEGAMMDKRQTGEARGQGTGPSPAALLTELPRWATS